MNIPHRVDVAVQGFHAYISGIEDADSPSFGRLPSVEKLIDRWLHEGEAVQDCYKDFRIFLSAVAVIFANWHDERFGPTVDESSYDSAIPWSITEAMEDEPGSVIDFFDPYEFQGRLCDLEEAQHSQLLDLLHRR